MNAGAPAAPTKRRCAVEGCESTKIHGGGMCQKHRRRQRLHGDALRTARPAKVEGGCAVEGCERPHHAHGLCRRHWEAAVGRATKHNGNRNFRPLDTPDPAPVRRLRFELQRRRALGGVSFALAWSAATANALEGVHDARLREEWRKALEQTRGAWHDAFLRLPVSDRLRPFARLALVDDDDAGHVDHRRDAPTLTGVRNPR